MVSHLFNEKNTNLDRFSTGSWAVIIRHLPSPVRMQTIVMNVIIRIPFKISRSVLWIFQARSCTTLRLHPRLSPVINARDFHPVPPIILVDANA